MEDGVPSVVMKNLCTVDRFGEEKNLVRGIDSMKKRIRTISYQDEYVTCSYPGPIKLCGPSKFTSWVRKHAPRGVLSRVGWDFLYGLDSDIPLCCVSEFTVRHSILGQVPGEYCPPHRVNCGWVPCVLHRTFASDPELEENR